MKLDALGDFVPLYFSLDLTFFITYRSSPGAIVELEKSVFSNFLLYKLQTFGVVIWIKERKHKFLEIFTIFELNMLVHNFSSFTFIILQILFEICSLNNNQTS